MESFIDTGLNFFQRHRIFIKGIIMGFLILVMMIPTLFVGSLVNERKGRQQEIVREVSSKWSDSQIITGPYIYIPYTDTNGIGKHFLSLPETLNVNGELEHSIRRRSIYNVLLYTASLKQTGVFNIKIPADINATKIRWKDAQICFGLSDYRGIEERIVVNLKGKEYELAPGMPVESISKKGLSAPIDLSLSDMNTDLAFGMRVKLKGSEDLKFVPLAGNSSYTLRSTWPSPSFAGSMLPTEHHITASGFDATWKFNKANLPFSITVREFQSGLSDINFGVSLLQPADQYAKTERSVKYAILFIGLTFGIFFIVEITRRKQVHPLQYVLIGLALVIFYTLLLSISEFVHFDLAYLLSAFAVVVMITLYSKQLFRSNKASLITGGSLALQYGFIFVLIRLEDTALLVGSIGLFIVLAVVMYASRNIDWYGAREKLTPAHE